MPADLDPLHADLAFLAPLSEARADALAAWLAEGLDDGDTVVDAGCGWGELLLRVVAAADDARGLGVDLDPAALDVARTRAVERGLGGRVRFEAGDVASACPDQAAAIIAVGASHAWSATDGTEQPLDYGTALTALRSRVPRSARVLYAEGIWSRPPTPAAVAPLSGRTDEFIPLAELVDLAVAHGFEPVGVGEATLPEWDAFESGFCAAWARWLAAQPTDHPEASAVRERLARQRAGYLRGYRGVLGFGYLQLLAA